MFFSSFRMSGIVQSEMWFSEPLDFSNQNFLSLSEAKGGGSYLKLE